MAAWLTRASSNAELVRELEDRGVIRKQAVRNAMIAVDRKEFVPAACKDEAYCDAPLRNGNHHQSAPHMYIAALEALDLQPKQSFLNVGSGTGYFSALVSEICGPNAIHHGVEIHGDVINHARRCRLAALRRWLSNSDNSAAKEGNGSYSNGFASPSFGYASRNGHSDARHRGSGSSTNGRAASSSSSSSSSNSSYEAQMNSPYKSRSRGEPTKALSHGSAFPLAAAATANGLNGKVTSSDLEDPVLEAAAAAAGCPLASVTFVLGNIFSLDTAHCRRYDRVYVGAECRPDRRQALCDLLEVGGVLVGPFGEDFLRIRRVDSGTGPAAFAQDCVAAVRFAPLLTRPNLPCVLPKTVWSPLTHQTYPKSFKVAVETVLMCLNKGSAAPAASLPRMLWLHVLSFADRDFFVPQATALARLSAQLATEVAAREVAERDLVAEKRIRRQAEQERDTWRMEARRLRAQQLELRARCERVAARLARAGTATAAGDGVAGSGSGSGGGGGGSGAEADEDSDIGSGAGGGVNGVSQSSAGVAAAAAAAGAPAAAAAAAGGVAGCASNGLDEDTEEEEVETEDGGAESSENGGGGF